MVLLGCAPGALMACQFDTSGLRPPASDGGGAVCGNGLVEPGETCDPPETCPAGCTGGSGPCQVWTLTGSADTCTAACSLTTIRTCTGEDGCCPAGCTTANDTDCSAFCGDGVRDPGETCDPPDTCPAACSDDGDPCTRETLSGSAANCNAQCEQYRITTCASGDGCCPGGCTSANDSDCTPICGDGVVDPSTEQCDDGNTSDGDGCSSACQWEQTCAADYALECNYLVQSAPPGNNDVHGYSCLQSDPESGPDTVVAFTPESSGTATVQVSSSSGQADYDVFILKGACNPALCFDHSAGSSDESFSFSVETGTTYYIAVEKYSGTGGFQMILQCY